MSVRTIVSTGLGLAGVIAASWIAATNPSTSAASGPPTPGLLPEHLVPALAAEQGADDLAPAQLTEHVGVQAHTSRSLGEFDGARFWIASTPHSDLCLVTQLPDGPHARPGENPVAGVSCTTTAMFASDGISVSLDGYTAAFGIVAHVLPPDASSDSARTIIEDLPDGRAALLTRESTNVVVIDSEVAGAMTEMTVDRRSGGEALTLPTMELCTDGCG